MQSNSFTVVIAQRVHDEWSMHNASITKSFGFEEQSSYLLLSSELSLRELQGYVPYFFVKTFTGILDLQGFSEYAQPYGISWASLMSKRCL